MSQESMFMLGRKKFRTTVPSTGISAMTHPNNAFRQIPTMTMASMANTAVIKPPAELASKNMFANSGENKMKWGKHIWNLIHAMTVLVKDEEFPRIKTEMLNMLFMICTNLPCPICSDHAKEYLKGINFQAIQTKAQCMTLFYQFHNFVNNRKNQPVFPQTQLEETYKTAILNNMLTNFEIAFRDHTYNPKHIYDQHVRSRVLQSFIQWFQKNRASFD